MERARNETPAEFESRRQNAGDFILSVVKQRDDRQHDAAARLLASLTDEALTSRFPNPNDNEGN